jgi:outer membrane cobalamin receptor
MFRFDRTNDDAHALQLDGGRRVGQSMRFVFSGFGETRETSTIRTLALAPGFGDTRERETSGNRLWGSVQFEMTDTPFPWADRVVLGTDVSYGKLRSTWHGLWTGDRDSYSQTTGARQTLDADGDVSRRTAALFAQYFMNPSDRLQITLGVRLDEISDRYEARGNSNLELDASQSALSPKAGINFRYAERPGFSGSFFVNGSGSFKAPTLDQLFDQRPIPLPEPPFSATTSNSLLSPQLGAGVEAGIYQYMTSQDLGTVLLSISGYETTMRDEIDFDVATLRYVNIARSRHRGLETGVRWAGSLPVSLFGAHTLQSVTSLRGPNNGKQLKAVPSQQLNVGATLSALDALQATAIVSHTGSGWVDDVNTVKLPGFTRTDLRFTYTWQALSVFADVTNIFDTKYNTTAFLDPAGTGERYISPAAGRMIMIGIRNGR